MSNTDVIGNVDEIFSGVGSVTLPYKLAAAILLNITDTQIDIDLINSRAQEGLLFFTEDGHCLPAKDDASAIEQDAFYKVVPCGYKQGATEQDLCASFARRGDAWSGAYIGSISTILQGIFNRWNSSHMDKRYTRDCPEIFRAKRFDLVGFGWDAVYAHNKVYLSKFTKISNLESTDVPADVIQSIYSDCLTPEVYGKRWRSLLRQHLKWILMSVAEDQKLILQLAGNGYILTKDKSTSLINTGILDKFGNDILLLDYDNKIYNMESKRLSRAYSKSYMISAGFTFEDLKELPAPIKFYSDKADLIFDGDESVVDLGSTGGMAHIIEERRSRLPPEYQDLPADFIFDKIKLSILNAIKISKRDYRYILPIYQTNSKSIAYLFPLKLAAEGVQGALVMNKSNGYYSPATLLTLSDAYMDASLICNPVGSWLDSACKECVDS